jgi:hypothetical protein
MALSTKVKAAVAGGVLAAGVLAAGGVAHAAGGSDATSTRYVTSVQDCPYGTGTTTRGDA